MIKFCSVDPAYKCSSDVRKTCLFGTEHNRCHVIMVLVIFAVKMQPQSNESSIMS